MDSAYRERKALTEELNRLRVPDLKNICMRIQSMRGGRKADLVSRLVLVYTSPSTHPSARSIIASSLYTPSALDPPRGGPSGGHAGLIPGVPPWGQAAASSQSSQTSSAWGQAAAYSQSSQSSSGSAASSSQHNSSYAFPSHLLKPALGSDMQV